jgi:glycosyltransferase involved in cell wall biosynthesis
MKILIVTQYFYPENFKSNDLAFELKNRGHDVTVLTGLPNYPEGRLYEGYGFFKRRKEKINGINVIRALLFLRGKKSGWRLILNYFTWAFFASIKAFFLAFKENFDAIIVHEPSPITQGLPAIVIKKINKTPIYFWVLDLWPESLQSAGGINNKLVLGFFNQIVKYVYNNSDKILISSRGFSKSILNKGDYLDKLVYFPNWAEDVVSKGDINYPIPDLPQGFKITFAGNIGTSQDMKSVMKSALLLRDKKDIHFIIIGEGRAKEWLERYVNDNELNETVHLLGRFPIDAMRAFFEKSDALLVTLKDDITFNLTVPAKLQAYMSVGKPILSMLNGEGSKIIKNSKAGLVANAGDFEMLTKNILALYNSSPEIKTQMGKSAKEYYDSNFKLEHCISNLEDIISVK